MYAHVKIIDGLNDIVIIPLTHQVVFLILSSGKGGIMPGRVKRQ